jgi:hypothetical protein
VASGTRGWGRLFRIGALAGVLMLSTAASCEDDLRKIADDLDIDLDGADELHDQREAQRAGDHPFGGDEDQLRRWCVAWADTHQGIWRDGYFPGNVRKENGFAVDHGNMKPHYDIVWEAFVDAYALAPDDIHDQVHELRLMVSAEMDALENYGWNFYDAISDGALDMSVQYAAEKARWVTPIDGLAEWWCWEDPGLRGPD